MKKLSRAYNTGGHLVFGILAYSEVSRLPLAQIRKLQIHFVLVILIVLTGIHLVEHVDQGRKVLLLRRQLIVDISDQGDIQERLCLYPKVISAFSFTLGVGDQDGDELQDVLFRMNIGERIVVHRLLEVDRIEGTHVISGGDQHFSGLNDQGPFGSSTFTLFFQEI